MEKYFTHLSVTLVFSLVILFSNTVVSQNALIGDGFGSNNWSTVDIFIGSAGTSRIGTFTANATGDRYFRLVTNLNSNNNEWGPNSTSNDYTITIGTEVPASEIVENSTTKAYKIVAPNTSDNYIFKTKEAGNPPSNKGLIVFRVQGTIQTVSSVSTPASTIYPGLPYTVTATTTGTTTGQSYFLRCTNDDFATSTVVAMTGSGTSYSATIPPSINSAGKTVKYYVFSSGNGLTITAANADWYTINLNNNGGSNYSYIVSYTTANSGNWSLGTTWVGGVVPPDGQPVTVANGHTLTLDMNALVSSITIQSGGTFIGSDENPSNTIRKLTIATGGTFIKSGAFQYGEFGTISFAGNGTISSTTNSNFGNLEISGAITFPSSTTTVHGKFVIFSGGSISTNPPNYSTTSTLVYSTGNTSTDPYNRNNEWGTTGSKIPYNVSIEKTTYLNLGANGGTAIARSCRGNLVIQAESGLFMDYSNNDMTNTLTIDGNLNNKGTISLSESIGGDLIVKGNILDFGIFNHHDRTVYLRRNANSVEQEIGGRAASLGYLNIENPDGARVITSFLITVNKNLSIASDSKLVLPNISAMTVVGSIINDAGQGGIIIESDEFGTGSLIQNTSGLNATVQRYMNDADWTNWEDGWHFISSPVSNQAISPAFTTDPYDFYSWWEATNIWVNFKNTTIAPTWNTANNNSSDFLVGKGYMVAYDNAATKNFTGTLNINDVLVTNLVITGTTQTNRSWHLLGNPFSSALLWDASGDWGMANISGVAGVWNESLQDYTDLTSSPPTVIPATNGFMVRVVENTGNLKIPASKRTHSSQSFYKSDMDDLEQIRLICKTADNMSGKESAIIANADATIGYDLMFDGEFLHGFGPQFYSIIEDMNLSTNSIPVINETTQIPFGFVKNAASDFKIELQQGIEGYKVFLKDLKANVDHNLTANPVYAFTSLEGDDANRFLLHFKSTLGTDDTEKPEQLSMYYNNGSVYVSGAAGKAELFVRNMLGQVVIQQAVNGDGLQVVNTGNLADGVYVVSLVGSGSTKSQKIVIK